MREQPTSLEELASQAEQEKRITDAQKIVWANLQKIEKDWPKGSPLGSSMNWDGVEFNGYVGDTDDGTLAVMADFTGEFKRLNSERFTGVRHPVDLSGKGQAYYESKPQENVKLVQRLSEEVWEGIDEETKLALVQDAIRQVQASEESSSDTETAEVRLRSLAALKKSLAEGTAEIEVNYGSVGLIVKAGKKEKE